MIPSFLFSTVRFCNPPEVKFLITWERKVDFESFAILIRPLRRFCHVNSGKGCRIMTVDPRVSGWRNNVGVIGQLMMGIS